MSHNNMLLLLLALLQAGARARLTIVSSSAASVVVRAGEEASLQCTASQPWYLCVWRGPGGRLISKTADSDCTSNAGAGFRLTGAGRGRRCQLTIAAAGAGEAGRYSCVMADRADVDTMASREVALEVAAPATARWLQGSVLLYGPEEAEVSLTCVAEGGHPRPSLVIRAEAGTKLTEVTDPGLAAISADETLTSSSSGGLEAGPVSRRVLVDTRGLANNSLVSCHAEQRHGARLLYNSSVAVVRLEEALVPVASTLCEDWWCEYQVFLFIMLVMVVLIIFSCCGMYFFFATRGKPYSMVMYNSEHGTWGRDQDTPAQDTVKEKLLEKKSEAAAAVSPGFGLRAGADIIRSPDLHPGLYSQVDRSKKAAARREAEVQQRAAVLETDLDNTDPAPAPEPAPAPQDDSIVGRVVTDFDTTHEETSSFLSKDNITVSNDTSRDSDPSHAGATEEEEEEEKRKFLLTMTEEEIMFHNTETTLEMIYRKYRNKNRSRSNLGDEEEAEDEFIAETEMRKYALHKYKLENVRNVKRLGRTYSKVVRDHLSNDPKLAVSESSVEFEVARPSSALSFCNRSNTSSPYPASARATPKPPK